MPSNGQRLRAEYAALEEPIPERLTALLAQLRKVLATNDVRTLIANNLRSLVGRCLATQQLVDLQIYADCTTLARIWSNSIRFQCPHCSAEHETKLEGIAPVITVLR